MRPPIEIVVPDNLKPITRIAAEYGTICIHYKDKIIRFTLYPRDINRTIQGFHLISYQLHFMVGTCSFDRVTDTSLAEGVKRLISDKWLTIIGVED